MNKRHRPFWLPASNYYVLAVAISTAFFFLVWGILNDGGDDMPWITAGITASMLLAGAVVLREVILRRARGRFLAQHGFVDRRVPGFRARIDDDRVPNKLTIETNARLLHEIKQKSDAAKMLSRFSASHREVFELCSEYLAMNERELKVVNAGSPRLAPLLKGRTLVSDYHRYHLLKWAEIESRTLTNEARNRIDPADQVEAAETALRVIETALSFYPSDTSLIQSRHVLGELVVSMNVAHLVAEAESYTVDGDFERARQLFREALMALGSENVQSSGREQAAKKINAELERIRDRENGL